MILQCCVGWSCLSSAVITFLLWVSPSSVLLLDPGTDCCIGWNDLLALSVHWTLNVQPAFLPSLSVHLTLNVQPAFLPSLSVHLTLNVQPTFLPSLSVHLTLNWTTHISSFLVLLSLCSVALNDLLALSVVEMIFLFLMHRGKEGYGVKCKCWFLLPVHSNADFQVKSSVRVLKDQDPGKVEGLLNALR